MRFIALVAALLCASLGLATPFAEMRRQRAAEGAPVSGPFIPAEGARNNVGSDSYNWAGAVLSGQGINSVYAEIVVPTPQASTNNVGRNSSALVWVGIDGFNCSTGGILQTGISMSVSDLGEVSYNAWFDWFPDILHPFDNITIEAGDLIFMSVSLTSDNRSGVALVYNLSNKQSASHDFDAEAVALCETSADWIIEHFYLADGTEVPFLNFGAVDFNIARAEIEGVPVGVNGSTLVNIELKGKIVTDCSMPNNSTIACQYIG